jgi:arylsulfatase A-like enzyme
LGEKQHWGKWTGWERSTRVPLVIVPAQSTARGFVVGQVCHRPVSLIDLYPTLVEMCGLPNPSQPLSGESLNSLLQSPNAKTDRGVISTFGKDRYSYRDDRYRLIHYEDDSVELYDLRTDPNEWHNLAAIEPGIVDRLRRRLDSEISR